VDECKPLPWWLHLAQVAVPAATATRSFTPPLASSLSSVSSPSASLTQGLTLVHLSAQRKRVVWDRGCI